MQYVNLIDKISEADKKTIENYIYTYGIKKDNFIGFNEYFSNWSHAKQKLYKLLGEELIVKIPIEYEKGDSEVRKEIQNIFYDSLFYLSYKDFVYNYIDKYMTGDIKAAFHELLYVDVLVHNEIFTSIKIPKTETKKTLQIPAGTKPMKAYSKIIEYFSDVYTFKGFEDLRIKHSIILTDKHIKTNLCLSIHPLDFITMSDNDSNWSSCMSWKNDGCYKIGSVEMMNSNNVLCCYLESSSHSYCFNEAEDETSTWNNKTYRILFYVTKDIIMSGKSYPYANDNIAKIALEEIKKLAEKNLHWTYQYGIEQYEDMKYLNTMYSMDRARWYMKNDPQKKNIIWDTKGMYNDMLNDHNTTYWCYRNKPKHPKMISVSGKAPCLCCGENSVIEKDSWAEDYNDKYSGVSQLICEGCRYEVESCCTSCHKTSYTEDYPQINYAGTNNDYLGANNNIWRISQSITLCPNCIEDYIKVCPCCGRPFLIDNIDEHYDSLLLGSYNNTYIENQEYEYFKLDISKGRYGKISETEECGLEYLYACGECIPKIKEVSTKIILKRYKEFFYAYILPINKYQDYRYTNLLPYGKITDVFY